MEVVKILVLAAFLACLVIVGAIVSCDRSEESDGDDGNPDNDDDDEVKPPVWLTSEPPEGTFQCDMSVGGQFETGFCEDCCSDMTERNMYGDLPTCEFFVEIDGKTWSVCSSLSITDWTASCLAELAFFCGDRDWRLPTLSELQELRASSEAELFSFCQDWLWAEAPRDKTLEDTPQRSKEDSAAPSMVCFNFRTGAVACETFPYDRDVASLYVRP